MKRRQALGLVSISLVTPFARARAAYAQHPGGVMPAPHAPALQGPDPEPQVHDIEKYPSCAYCGMNRRTFHHSRMLIHYADGTVDPLCSMRCAANSLAVHLGKMPVALWVGDNAGTTDPLPLTDAEKATYLIGSSIRGVMTRRSKVAYSTPEAASRAKVANGGEVVDFNTTLAAAYADIAEGVSRYLKTNAERLKRAGKDTPR
jgi:copper chaperone NosL